MAWAGSLNGNGFDGGCGGGAGALPDGGALVARKRGGGRFGDGHGDLVVIDLVEGVLFL